MKIGIPKESLPGENRVAATPETVKKMIAKGVTVLVETGAGQTAFIPDAAFAESGAQIVTNQEALAAQVVLKVQAPNPEELAQMQSGSLLISFADLCDREEALQDIAAAGISLLAMEAMPRISRAQSMDALSSQANIGGYRAALEAAARYGRFLPMMMTAAGAAKPARLVVLGAGVAGLQAIATARRLGADVSAYDVRPEVKEQIESLGAKFIELDLSESGSGSGGYARELSEEAKQNQLNALGDVLVKANIIISTALIPCRPAPTLISEACVQGMQEGAVIIDMAAAAGGNCPLSEADKVVCKHGVTIIGYTNFPALVAADASAFYARNLFNLLSLLLIEQNGKPALQDFHEDEITTTMLVTHEGGVIAKA